ncbi:HD-GYP domain-containing protein [Salipaludibacillus sp. CF4.18]|uniref:HD-GYP domain-containing protein n=1 Tax=Salipaludibacillus sp. CF4.18 TaxID=3373081 RepID=UPI003EE718DF
MREFQNFQKKLFFNYIIGSIIAVFGVGSVFIFHTLDLSSLEIRYLLFIMAVSGIIMIVGEFALYRKHIKPLREFFKLENPQKKDFDHAYVTTHRFPMLTVKRILGPHLLGLSIPASVMTYLFIYTDLINLDYYYIGLAWAGAILIAVMHALIEFFLTYNMCQKMAQKIEGLARRTIGESLTIEGKYFLSIRRKLLVSTLFTATFPVSLFILASQIRAVENYSAQSENYWSWASLIVVIILGVSICGAVLLYSSIQEPIQSLRSSFDLARDGHFEEMENSYSDEFASLITGYNHMIRGIQERDDRNDQLLSSFFSVIAATLDARDPYTAGHSTRVADYAVKIAEKARFTSKQTDLLKKSALLHDIGKIGIRDKILLKESRLTDAEFTVIKQHPIIGANILEQVLLPEELKPILPGVKYHHERMDGLGYPEGLTGDEIPLFGRVLAVADAFDAMTSDRPYVKGMPFSKALDIIESGKGTQWDPYFASLFLEIMGKDN